MFWYTVVISHAHFEKRDEEWYLQGLQDKKKKVVVDSTDLSAAFNAYRKNIWISKLRLLQLSTSAYPMIGSSS